MSRSGPNAALSDGIQQLSKSNGRLERMLAKIGTKADTADFRDRMHQEQTASTTQVKQLMQLLKQLTQESSSNGGPSAVVQRLATQFDREFKKFQQLNNSMDSKQVRVIDAVKESQRKQSVGVSGFHASQYDEEDPLNTSNQRVYDEPPSQQQQQEQASEVDIKFVQFEVAELEQRRVEIGRIEQDVLEVSEMYKDLQSLVHEQQEHIDTIDSSIVAARDRTEEGHNELLVAEEYQKKARKKQCCMLFLVLTVLAVIVVVIVLLK